MSHSYQRHQSNLPDSAGFGVGPPPDQAPHRGLVRRFLRGALSFECQWRMLPADFPNWGTCYSITEAHPKALDWLDHSMRSCIIDLPPDCRDHERDATFAAYAAWCMHRKAQGWRNLFPKEPNPILPLGTPVSYWMPIPKQDPGQVNLNL